MLLGAQGRGRDVGIGGHIKAGATSREMRERERQNSLGVMVNRAEQKLPERAHDLVEQAAEEKQDECPKLSWRSNTR
jgi:hypothetical protein